MKEVTLTPKTKGVYLVQFKDPSFSAHFGNDPLAATIAPYDDSWCKTDKHKNYYKNKLTVKWKNGMSDVGLPEDYVAFEIENKVLLNFVRTKHDLFEALSKIEGAAAAHGEASFGYALELKNGTTLIIGQSDDDVSEEHILWIKQLT